MSAPSARHTIHVPPTNPTLTPLTIGGINPQGRAIHANQRYLTLDGRPWLPVMGEFHFSRCRCEDWETELLKMKAGGITVIATYLFWIHIEEIEGQFIWEGNNNLRCFVELCARHGLYAYPRIGPWAHGECRNGGFPDWLLERCGNAVRQDAEPYLTYARRFYSEIAHQLAGLLWKDGGPVIGIQLENELLNNATHIATLKRMAVSVGLDVPLYTMTGWGPAAVPEDEEVLPVFGGYPDAFWERQVQTWARDSRKHFFFSALRDDNTIGADLNKRAGLHDLSYLERFPFGTCEMGGGMQVAYHRRPWIDPDDIAAPSLVKIGSGSNLQGYYMYHGGSNPLGQRSTMQESQATGYWNDVPVINYDFQAPLGEYGQVRESYHRLRALHLFLNDFGETLAPLPAHLPKIMPSGLDDRSTPRWSVRSDGSQGFLFINNYQRIEALGDQEGIQFEVELPGETFQIPTRPTRIPGGVYSVWPFNLDLCGALLKQTTLQPVCRLAGATTLFVFAQTDGVPVELIFAASTVKQVDGQVQPRTEGKALHLDGITPGSACRFTITAHSGQAFDLLVLTAEQARRAWKAPLWGQERLILSGNSLYFTGEQLHIQAAPSESVDIELFPACEHPLWYDTQTLTPEPDGVFQRIRFALPGQEIPVNARKLQSASRAPGVRIGPLGVAQPPEDSAYEQAEVWQINLPPGALRDIDQAFLVVDYTGDAAQAYLGERLVADDFCYGRAWEIELTRLADELEAGEPLLLRFLPLRRDAPIYLPESFQPDFVGQEQVLQVRAFQIRVQYSLFLVSQ